MYVTKAQFYLFRFSLVPEYDLTVPYPSQDESHRQKRSVSHVELAETKSYKLKAFGKELPLKLSLNKNVMSRDLRVEVMQRGGRIEYHRAPRNTFYLGKVSTEPESMVAVSDAEGLVRPYCTWSLQMR